MESIAPSIPKPIPPDARLDSEGILDIRSDDEEEISAVIAEINATFPTGNEEIASLSLEYSIPSPPMLVGIQKQDLVMGSIIKAD